MSACFLCFIILVICSSAVVMSICLLKFVSFQDFKEKVMCGINIIVVCKDRGDIGWNIY